MKQESNRPACILFGNGVNRAIVGNEYPTWDQILTEIANEFYAFRGRAEQNTLQFDTMLCTGLQKLTKESANKVVSEVLTELDQKIDSLPRIFQQLFCTQADIFLTTNFDYMFERAISTIYGESKEVYSPRIVGKNETYITNKRRTELPHKKRIFHIHGELELPNTICLGLMHYASNLSKIMESILGKDDEGQEYFLAQDCLSPSGRFLSWAQYFFSHDVYILGFGLDNAEVDIWWILAYRNYLMSSNDSAKPTNNVVYLCAYSGEPPESCQTLRNMNVRVRYQEVVDSDWETAYLKLIESIPKENTASEAVKGSVQ